MIKSLTHFLLLAQIFNASALLNSNTQHIILAEISSDCMCPKFMQENSVCDAPCNNLACGFDGGLCPQTEASPATGPTAEISPDCKCPKFILSNGRCDTLCDTDLCNHDGGDCPIPSVPVPIFPTANVTFPISPTTNLTVPISLPVNITITQPHLNQTLSAPTSTNETTAEPFLPTSAPQAIPTVSISPSEAPSASISETYPSSLTCECSEELLNNSICDYQCNTLSCRWDNGSCVSFPGCSCDKNMLGDGVCNQECNTPDCYWDMNDCLYIHPGCLCHKLLIGDGICDSSCNTSLCGWDGGDCS
jgi:hypothetical protein